MNKQLLNIYKGKIENRLHWVSYLGQFLLIIFILLAVFVPALLLGAIKPKLAKQLPAPKYSDLEL